MCFCYVYLPQKYIRNATAKTTLQKHHYIAVFFLCKDDYKLDNSHYQRYLVLYHRF